VKRVFLIGDSIRIGYCEKVAELLQGRAEVLYPSDNCRFTHYVLASLGLWAMAVPKRESVDVVHWNCGQWDMAQFEEGRPLLSVDEYARALQRVHWMIRRCFPNAQIIFALTTPVLDDRPLKAPRTTADVVRYNNAAKTVMQELGVPIDDLFEAAQIIPREQYADAVHFTSEGYRVLAQAVVRSMEKYISDRED
jgi:acyl-CoA thioesterase-1